MAETYTRLTDEMLEEVYDFHKRYTGEKRSRNVWEWQYGKKNPHQSVLVGIRKEDKLIATQGMFAVKLNTGNTIELTGKNESLLIDESFRGIGLSQKLYSYAIEEYGKEGITCLWGFSKKAIVPLQKAGFNVYFNVIRRSIISLDFAKALYLANKKNAPVLKKMTTVLFSIFGTLYSKTSFKFASWHSANFKKSRFEVSDSIKHHEDLIKFYLKVRESYPDIIHINQDDNYYKWRIIDSPIEIIKYFLYDKDILLGYFYLTPHNDYTEITDLTFIQDRHGILLINEIIKFIKRNKVKVLYYNYNSQNMLNIYINSFLNKIGFINVSGPNHFVLRNFKHNESERFFDIKNWYINNLWSEGV